MAIATIASSTMACPYFLPVTPLAGSAAASPLGAVFSGSCAAAPETEPSEVLLRTGCNQGYARAFCPHAAASQVDAARFRIKSHHAGVIEVAWSHERDHHPVAVGVLRLREDQVDPAPLEAQARACIAVYLRRKGVNW